MQTLLDDLRRKVVPSAGGSAAAATAAPAEAWPPAQDGAAERATSNAGASTSAPGPSSGTSSACVDGAGSTIAHKLRAEPAPPAPLAAVDVAEASVERPRVVVISFRMAEILRDDLSDILWGAVVVDESHVLRACWNKDAQQTEAVTRLVRGAPRAVLMSGTPSLNRPFDLFSQVRLAPEKVTQPNPPSLQVYPHIHPRLYSSPPTRTPNYPPGGCPLAGPPRQWEAPIRRELLPAGAAAAQVRGRTVDNVLWGGPLEGAAPPPKGARFALSSILLSRLTFYQLLFHYVFLFKA